ncbi:hypothetical protein RHMOL_Rhmol12G0007000 [Rhododendron molle]|uniref:Uncharacterized protein n=1 Tax=Rhododendron molle TaxID=49168 RepID=A0ACC0LDC2_RHOML|nr:hypothetical protein RHMOL_Rhmol12G0007000 [Rhododendron molle]
MTKLGCWNIRGLNNPLKQKEVLSFIRVNCVSLFGVVEAKIRPENMVCTTARCFPAGWQFAHNLVSFPVARIIVGWDPSLLSVSIISCSDQLITLSVEVIADHKSLFVSVVYGLNLARERFSLWNNLRSLFPVIGSSAWTLMGDFNVVRSPIERLMSLLLLTLIVAWRILICKICLLKGIGTLGLKKGGVLGLIKVGLIYRVLVNDIWLNFFRDAEVVGHSPGISDHCPLVLSVVHKRFKAVPFRFYNFWMNNGGFKDLLIQSRKSDVVGNPMERLSLKLKGLKPLLKAFHKEHYNNLSGRVNGARENLAKILGLCFKFPADLFLHDLEKDLVQQFYSLSNTEESYKRQKSRVNWLALGDRNTKFFSPEDGCP